MPKEYTATISFKGNPITLTSTAEPFRVERIAAALELAQSHPSVAHDLLKQAGFPLGFVANVQIKASADDNTLQDFLDAARAIGIDLKVEITPKTD